MASSFSFFASLFVVVVCSISAVVANTTVKPTTTTAATIATTTPASTGATYCPIAETLTMASGYISHYQYGGYKPNENCAWQFASNDATLNLRIWFTYFMTVSNKDYVRVYSGTIASPSLYQTLSGTPTVPFLSTIATRTAVIRFASDSSNTVSNGFVLYYASISPYSTSCPLGTYLTLPTTLTHSINGLEACQWKISSTASSITIDVSYFDMTAGQVAVFVGSSASGIPYYTLNPGTTTKTMNVASGNVLIQYISTGTTNTGRGFSFALSSQTTTTSYPTFPGAVSNYYYGNNEKRTYVLVSTTSGITISFSLLSINQDYIRVYMGSTTYGTLLTTLTGSDSTPYIISVPASAACVEFASGSGTPGTGYSFAFTSSDGSISYNPYSPYSPSTGDTSGSVSVSGQSKSNPGAVAGAGVVMGLASVGIIGVSMFFAFKNLLARRGDAPLGAHMATGGATQPADAAFA